MNNKKSRRRKKVRKINFDSKKAVKLYANGNGFNVADIAVEFGYERGTGQNRVRAALMKAGVYKQVRTAAKAQPAKGKVLTMAVPTGPEMALQECYRVVQSRYNTLHGRARTGFVQKLSGMLLTGLGETATTKIHPVELPAGLPALRKVAA